MAKAKLDHANLSTYPDPKPERALAEADSEAPCVPPLLAEGNEAHLDAVVNNIGDPIFVKDDQCRLLFVNDAFCDLFAMTRSAIIGRTLGENVAQEEREHFLAVDQKVLTTGSEDLSEETLTTAGKPTRTILTRKSRYVDPAGGHFLVGVIHDITERKEKERQLNLAASVFSNAREGIIITNASGTVIEANHRASEITGYESHEIIGEELSLLSSSVDPQKFQSEVWPAINAVDFWSGEVWGTRKSGEHYPQKLTVSAVKNVHGDINNLIAFISDITVIRGYQKELARMAHYDSLTNLPNRSLLMDRVNHAMAQCARHTRSLAILFLDLDGFKQVNDAYGHAAGDEFLVALSLNLAATLRDADTLARLGGDEFIILLDDVGNASDCLATLDRLLDAASTPILLGDQKLAASASIGITIYPDDKVDADALIRHADQAMYGAKQSGKNRYAFFDPSRETMKQTHTSSNE